MSQSAGNKARPCFRRWNGKDRITTPWDGLHRDPELWFADGDCFIHLYAPGQSKRGPSFCVPLSALERHKCQPLLEKCVLKSSLHPGQLAATAGSGRTQGHQSVYKVHDLYIPGPAKQNVAVAHQHHITTRNFFAWMFKRPVVGSKLGQALIDLLNRMNLYRSNEEQNKADMFTYLDRQGYSDFRECVDHALGVLNLAEAFEMEDLWADAFAHCVGMNDRLLSTSEFDSVSRVTMAMIYRARLEMDIRLERANDSLTSFLEDELSTAHLGLGKNARIHLDQFRSFLYSYYVGKYGYWPPSSFDSATAYSRSTYLSMYYEFRSLYEYLLDPGSTTSIQNNKWASGGICVLQNIRNFDSRRQYEPLPHPLPRLPNEGHDHSYGTSTASGEQSCKQKVSMNSLISKPIILGGKEVHNRRKQAVSASLATAANRSPNIVSNPLVKEYIHLEKNVMLDEHKISITNGRKVRWMLIYGMLQTLVSVTQMPTEVTDTEDVSYGLCCKIPKQRPWMIGIAPSPANSETNVKLEIQPDVNYLAMHGSESTTSLASLKSRQFAKSVSREHSPSSANVKLIIPQTSVRRLLPKRSCSKEAVLVLKPNFCEILVHGYGNGLNPTTKEKMEAGEGPEPTTPVSRESSTRSTWSQSNKDSNEGDFTDMDHHSVDGEVDLPSRTRAKGKVVHFLEPEKPDA